MHGETLKLLADIFFTKKESGLLKHKPLGPVFYDCYTQP